MDYNTDAVISGIGQLNFCGNIIPHTWYKHITFENGKPDLLGIVILADIVYWYRPTEIKDEASGALLGFKKKFKFDMLQRSSRSFAEQFGITKRQASEALKRLSDYGLIIRQIRKIKSGNGTVPNVQFIAPVVEAIARIQMPAPILQDTTDVAPAPENLSPLKPSIQESSTPSAKATTADKTPPRNQTQGGAHPITIPRVMKRTTYTKNITEITTHTAAIRSTSPQPAVNPPTVIAAADVKLRKQENNPIPQALHANLIGNTLTAQQVQEVQLRVKGLMQHQTDRTSQQLADEIIFTLQSKDTFTQCGTDFYKKLNTLCKYIRTGKWTVPAPLATQKIKTLTHHQRDIKLKWQQLHSDHRHWCQMLVLAEKVPKQSEKNITGLKKLIKDSLEKLQHFQQNHQRELNKVIDTEPMPLMSMAQHANSISINL